MSSILIRDGETYGASDFLWDTTEDDLNSDRPLHIDSVELCNLRGINSEERLEYRSTSRKEGNAKESGSLQTAFTFSGEDLEAALLMRGPSAQKKSRTDVLHPASSGFEMRASFPSASSMPLAHAQMRIVNSSSSASASASVSASASSSSSSSSPNYAIRGMQMLQAVESGQQEPRTLPTRAPNHVPRLDLLPVLEAVATPTTMVSHSSSGARIQPSQRTRQESPRVPISLDSPRSTVFSSSVRDTHCLPLRKASPAIHRGLGGVSISADSPRGRELTFSESGSTRGEGVSAVCNPAVSKATKEQSFPAEGLESTRGCRFGPMQGDLPFQYPSVHLDTSDSILPTPLKPSVSCLASTHQCILFIIQFTLTPLCRCFVCSACA